MSTREFVRQLRATAEVLKPLTQSAAPGAATWDGKSYVKGDAIVPDTGALVWWSILGTVADLIEAQESPLTLKQTAYLDRLLFGGMGSFNDVSFDVPGINQRLGERRHELFTIFKRLQIRAAGSP